MPDYFESGVLTDNEPAWHGAGIVVEDEVLTRERVFELLPLLASPVIKVPLYAAHLDETGNAHVVDTNGHHALVREADHKMLSVVQGRYTICQNDELFDFAEAIVAESAELGNAAEEMWLPESARDAGPAVWKTAGTLKDGKVVWGMLRLPGDIEIAGVPGERVVPYLSVRNTFDRSAGVSAAVHWTRIVCANTLGAAFNEAPRSFSIRHTESLKGRLLEARKALGMTYTYGHALADLGAELMRVDVSPRQFKRYLRDLIPLTVEAVESKKVRDNLMGLRDGLFHVYDTSANLQNIKGTAWGAYQATVEWEQHHRYPERTPDQRLKAMFDGSEYAPRALELLTA